MLKPQSPGLASNNGFEAEMADAVAWAEYVKFSSVRFHGARDSVCLEYISLSAVFLCHSFFILCTGR